MLLNNRVNVRQEDGRDGQLVARPILCGLGLRPGRGQRNNISKRRQIYI